jgi:hypothetical protein
MSSLHLASGFCSPSQAVVDQYSDVSLSTPSPPLYFASFAPSTTPGSRVHLTNQASFPDEGSLSSSSCASQIEICPSSTLAPCQYSRYSCTSRQACPARWRQRAGVNFLNFLASFESLKSSVRRNSLNAITLLQNRTLLKKRRCTQLPLSRAKAADNWCSRFPNGLSTALFESAGIATHAPELQKSDNQGSWVDLFNSSHSTAGVFHSNDLEIPETAASGVCSTRIFSLMEKREPSPGRSPLLPPPSHDTSNCKDPDTCACHSAHTFISTHSIVSVNMEARSMSENYVMQYNLI